MTPSGAQRSFPTRPMRVSPPQNTKGGEMPRSGIIWTIVGILLIIALLIYIF